MGKHLAHFLFETEFDALALPRVWGEQWINGDQRRITNFLAVGDLESPGIEQAQIAMG